MQKENLKTPQAGFSLVELLVVLAISLVLMAIAVPYLFSYRTLYRSEDQALKVMDLMREASQLAMNRRRNIRLEIDRTDQAILLIDENGAAPDTLIKSIPLDTQIRFDKIPSGVTKPNPPNYNDVTYATDALGHRRGSATVSGHQVWQAVFRSDGSVVNAANSPISANLYFWPPSGTGDIPRRLVEVRAITMFGGSGAVRYWRHDGTTFKAY